MWNGNFWPVLNHGALWFTVSWAGTGKHNDDPCLNLALTCLCTKSFSKPETKPFVCLTHMLLTDTVSMQIFVVFFIIIIIPYSHAAIVKDCSFYFWKGQLNVQFSYIRQHHMQQYLDWCLHNDMWYEHLNTKQFPVELLTVHLQFFFRFAFLHQIIQ